MGIELIMTVVMATSVGHGCSWAHPGANPYRGTPSAALADFPMDKATRSQLRTMMDAHRYTDVVTITRDDIVGKDSYNDLRMMHSGHGQLCKGGVDRSAWSPTHEERGLVYCVGETCVVVPTICNNVSLLSRRQPAAAQSGADEPIDITPAAGPPPAAQDTAGSTPTEGGPIDITPAAGFATPSAAGPGGDGGFGGGGFSPPPILGGGGCCVIGPGTPPVVGPPTAVPEVPIWAMLLAGLTLLLAARVKRA